jgi:hypothetical protein
MVSSIACVPLQQCTHLLSDTSTALRCAGCAGCVALRCVALTPKHLPGVGKLCASQNTPQQP